MRSIPIGLALVASIGIPSGGDDKAGAATPPFGDFVVIPIRVHVLKAEGLPEVDCGLKDAEVRRILDKTNAIWHRAGIHFGLESLLREPAARVDQFRAARDRDGPSSIRPYRLILPESSRDFDGVNVYFVHQFHVNGVTLQPDGLAIVKETARLRPVPGGLSEPIPRVVAHELGHILGLGHRADDTHLLSSGVSAFGLDPEEVARARRGARSLPGQIDVAGLRKAAEAAAAAGDVARARRDWSWLAEIPGEGAEEAKQKADALPVR